MIIKSWLNYVREAWVNAAIDSGFCRADEKCLRIIIKNIIYVLSVEFIYFCILVKEFVKNEFFLVRDHYQVIYPLKYKEYWKSRKEKNKVSKN